MAIFGKKSPAPDENLSPEFQEQAPEVSGPPTQRVLQMRQQGLSNNQIIQALQNEGYSPNQVFDAMNQADIKGGVEMDPTGGQAFQNPMQFQQQYPQQPQQPMGPPGLQMPPMGSPQGAPMQQDQESGMPQVELERIEEIAEAIIDEKWNDIVKSINKIIDWKDRTEQQIAGLQQEFDDLKKDFDKLHQGILGKIKEYDDNLTSVGSEIKAMEKAFQKVLPTLTENVAELSRITRDIKK